MTKNNLNEMFYQDIMSIFNTLSIGDTFKFQIQKYFKEFIMVYKGLVIPLRELNELQFEDNLKNLDMMRANLFDKNWHMEIKEYFMQKGYYFNVEDSETILCSLSEI
jgi:hypothetical protein